MLQSASAQVAFFLFNETAVCRRPHVIDGAVKGMDKLFGIWVAYVESPSEAFQGLAYGADLGVLLCSSNGYDGNGHDSVPLLYYPDIFCGLDDALVQHCVCYFHEASDVCALNVVDEVAFFTIANAGFMD